MELHGQSSRYWSKRSELCSGINVFEWVPFGESNLLKLMCRRLPARRRHLRLCAQGLYSGGLHSGVPRDVG